ncbi:MAG TPA: hypothetical protein VLA66_11510 [Thermoanaerobaculia bacterium]|nr:hypothetical protein [Thermoanaerobaculia bacterium]
MAEREFEQEVARALERAGIPFQRRVALGGVEPDFVVTAPDGRLVVVETKAWEASPGFAKHAEEQAEHYRALAGADAAYVVVRGLQRSRRASGVVTLDDLVESLRAELGKAGAGPSRRAPKLEPAARTIFAAMPFAREYEDTFFVAMAPAADAVGAVCKRVDREEYAGDVVARIESMIGDAAAVVADLSEARPNVLYEAGYARGLGKPTIAISSTPPKELPFDVNHWNILTYGRGQTHRLRSALTRRLKAVLS